MRFGYTFKQDEDAHPNKKHIHTLQDSILKCNHNVFFTYKYAVLNFTDNEKVKKNKVSPENKE